MALLVGDIGGTKTLLRLAAADDPGALIERRFASAEHGSAAAMIGELLDDVPTAQRRALTGICLAVAGPVKGGRARLTNLPFTLDEVALTGELGVTVRLLNDFEAAAWGLPALDEDDLVALQQAPRDEDGVRLVLGPGTGLGQALLVPAGGVERVVGSEAGHTDFAPADAQQTELLAHLRERFGRVTHERLLSGSGLAELYGFLRSRRAGSSEPDESAELAAALAREDPAAAITRFATEKKDPLARRTVELFCRLLGSYAGNAALQCLPRGGVYLFGGVAPHLRPIIERGGFREAFRDKPPMAELLAGIPVALVLDPRLGLLGAWRYGVRCGLAGSDA